jgi:hypothetical protein
MSIIDDINRANDISSLMRLKHYIFKNYVRVDISPFGNPTMYFIDEVYYDYTNIIDNKIIQTVNRIVNLN